MHASDPTEIRSCSPSNLPPIRELFITAEKGSEVLGFFRTGMVWAEHARAIQEAIESRGLKVSVVIAVDEPVLATKEDWGLSDIRSAAAKFRSIHVSSGSGGW